MRKARNDVELMVMLARHSGECRNPVPRSCGSDEILIQIAPIRIAFLDQLDLPCAVPMLEHLLARDSCVHREVLLVPGETMHCVVAREAEDQVAFVLPHALDQVRGYTNVECAVALAREDVDAGSLRFRGQG